MIANGSPKLNKPINIFLNKSKYYFISYFVIVNMNIDNISNTHNTIINRKIVHIPI